MSDQATPDDRPTVYVSAHFPGRKVELVYLTVQPAEGGFSAKPARGGPPLAGGATVGEAVERALAEQQRRWAERG